MGNYQNNGTLSEVLSFSVSPAATYITYKICPLDVTEQTCPKNQLCAVGGECWEQVTLYDRVALSYVGGGQIQVSAQACIDAQEALTNETCGPMNEILYNSNRYTGEVASLLSQREYIYSQYTNYALQLETVLNTFMTNSKADLSDPVHGCLQNNLQAYHALEAKVSAVQMYLQAPIDDTMDVLRSNAAGGAILSGLSTTLSQISVGLTKFCHDMATLTNSNKTCTILSAIGAVGLQLAYMLEPQNMLTNLVTAINTMQDNEAPKRCTSEDIFNENFQAINEVQQALYTQLQQINTQLQTYGY